MGWRKPIMNQLIDIVPHLSGRKTGLTTFNKAELSLILGYYSRAVADGIWRDYAIDHRPGLALFSFFKNAQQKPNYAISKISRGDTIEYALFAESRCIKKASRLNDVLGWLVGRPRILR